MKPFDSEDIGHYFNYNISIPTRSIYLGSESTLQNQNDEESGIDFRSSERIIKSLDIFQSLGEEPVKVYLNNPGGDEYHGLAIYDAFSCSSLPIYAYVYGQACSMASVILQSATVRTVMPSSTIMVHMGTLDEALDQRDIQANYEEWLRLNTLINDIYIERIREKNPRYSYNQLKELLSTDRYLSPKEAIDLGLADKIGG